MFYYIDIRSNYETLVNKFALAAKDLSAKEEVRDEEFHLSGG